MKERIDKFQPATRIPESDNDVWIKLDDLIQENGALNLGQGFPDFAPPAFVTEALKKVVNEDNPDHHQYTRSYGHRRIVEAIAKTFSREMNHPIDPLNDILIAVGAYGSLFYATQALLNPGDEVIILEPFFTPYEPMVKLAGGVPRFTPLKSTKAPGEPSTTADWTFDRQELEDLFNSNTKLLIFNNPNNPLGKVYSLDEMTYIADLCKKHNVVVISDEVYDRLIHPGTKFIRMASLPDMYNRTITVGSAGKSFSVTGWKLGWCIGPSHLISSLCSIHQNCVDSCPTLLQETIARCFEIEEELHNTFEGHFSRVGKEIMPKKDKMVRMLERVGVVPVLPEAGYFVVVDISKMGFEADPSSSESKCYQFVAWMCKIKKLSAVPNSAFYTDKHKHLADNFIRFCLFKKDETLTKAEELFGKWNQ